VFLWFAGGAWVLVWAVFADPAIDYRLVIAGVLLPDAIDAPFGGAGVAHTLAFSTGLLLAVMVVTRARRPARRRLLAAPIGTFIHLLLDGTWTRTRLFWWPFFGWGFGRQGLPSLGRPAIVIALEELLGAAALGWCWRAFGLSDPARRTRLRRTGRLDPGLGGRGRPARQ
jgi:hypothetical protein